MSERQSSVPFGSTILCVPLIKFSYAEITSQMTSVVPWNHIHSKELSVLLEPVRGVDSQDLQLRIVKGSQDMWIIPLSEHIRNALLVIQACVKDSSMFKKFDVLPMFAMTKTKTIAIRYNAGDNESRRTQMSFHQESHYKQLLVKLFDIGMVITDPGAKNRLSARPQLCSIPVPLYNQSTQASSIVFAQAPKAVLDQTPNTVLAHPISQDQRQYLDHRDAASKSFCQYPGSSSPTRPTSMESSLITYSGKSDTIATLSSDSSSPPNSIQSRRSSMPHTSSTTLHWSSSPPRKHDSIGFSEARNQETRPGPTSYTSSFQTGVFPSEPIVTLQDCLPPRRELPFVRKSAPPTQLAPLPKPKYVRRLASHESKPTILSAQSSKTVQERADNSISGQRHGVNLQGTATPQSRYHFGGSTETEHARVASSGMRCSSTLVDNDVREDEHLDLEARHQPRPSESVGDERSNGERYSSHCSSDVHNATSCCSGSAPTMQYHMDAEPRNANHDAPSHTTAEYQQTRHDDEIDALFSNPRFMTNLQSEAQTRSAGHGSAQDQALATYAANSQKEREGVLNNMICDLVENPDFEQLFTDVDSAWRMKILRQQRQPRDT